MKKKHIVIILILSSLIFFFIIYNQTVFSQIINIGTRELYYGDNLRGNKLINFALSKIENPSENIYHDISVQNTKNGNYGIAISALENAYNINPIESGAYYGWVLLYYYHDYEKALDVLNTYDNLTPGISDFPMGECIHYLKGLAYKELKNYEAALREFNLSIDNGLKSTDESWIDYQVFLNKGICMLYMEKYEDAILEFERTLNNYDKCSEAYYFIGLCNVGLNLNEVSCVNFKKSKTLITQGYKSMDNYVELFHEIYLQDVNNAILKHCSK